MAYGNNGWVVGKMNKLTTNDEIICRLFLLFWFIGFCVIMLSPIWLIELYGISFGLSMLILICGWVIWMLIPALVVL